MKDKKQILYERALITCVIMLFICVILKLFGANWFDFETDLPLLQKLDTIIISNTISTLGYSYILTYINGLLVLMITTTQLNKRVCFINFIISFVPVVSQLFINPNWVFFIDTFLWLVATLFIDKTKWKDFIICCLLNILYQIISIFIRSVSYGLGDYPIIIALLLNLDYYIMLIITYLYLKKGGVTLCRHIHHYGSFLAKKLCRKHLEN